MNGLAAVIRKEIKNFAGGGWGTFLLYAIICVAWSFPALFYGDDGIYGYIWIVFFAVIVTANFSGTVFISERVSGTLEVLITSGLSRDAVLFGKMIFVIAMTTIIGGVCAALAAGWGLSMYAAGMYDITETIFDNQADGAEWRRAHAQMIFNLLIIPPIYISAAFLNAAASAYFSVRLTNPRFLHFINLSITGAVAGVYMTASLMFEAPDYTLILGFFLLGALFTYLARREFAGERIIRPVIF